MRDDLRTWWAVRASVPWATACDHVDGPVVGARDGVVAFVDTVVRTRDPDRADRLLTALGQARVDADAGRPLSFERLASWQRILLNASTPVAFRTTPAFAKRGRERYSLDARTEQRFRDCLADSHDPAVPLAARAARVYLDVCFFHPFGDGNARAAMLTCYHALAHDGVVVDQAAPLLTVSRRADDPRGALALTRLIYVLITATRRRGSTADHHPWPGRDSVVDQPAAAANMPGSYEPPCW
jgi:hypothetical protein